MRGFARPRPDPARAGEKKKGGVIRTTARTASHPAQFSSRTPDTEGGEKGKGKKKRKKGAVAPLSKPMPAISFCSQAGRARPSKRWGEKKKKKEKRKKKDCRANPSSQAGSAPGGEGPPKERKKKKKEKEKKKKRSPASPRLRSHVINGLAGGMPPGKRREEKKREKKRGKKKKKGPLAVGG